jgi:hypothetical protein
MSEKTRPLMALANFVSMVAQRQANLASAWTAKASPPHNASSRIGRRRPPGRASRVIVSQAESGLCARLIRLWAYIWSSASRIKRSTDTGLAGSD